MDNKIIILCGEPYNTKNLLNNIIKKYNIENVYKFYDIPNNIEEIKQILFGITIFETNKMVILYDYHEILNDIIEHNDSLQAYIVLYLPNKSINKKYKFVNYCIKNNSIFESAYIEQKNKIELLKHIDEWCENQKIKLEPLARKWLYDNAPTTIVKINNKETEVYDLELLYNELDKIIFYCKNENIPITDKLLQDLCYFNREVNIWDFIHNVINTDIYKAFKLGYNLIENNQITNALYLLQNQLFFLIQLKQYTEKTKNPELLQQMFDINKYIKKYQTNEENEIKELNINIWRIKKSLETIDKLSINHLSYLLKITTNAITDLRFNLSEKIVIPYFILATAKLVNYDNTFIK